MRFPFIIILFVSAFVISSFDYNRAIRHDQGKALTWKDFRGRPDKSSKYAAKTSSGYNFNAFLVGDSMRIILPTLFHPRTSWVKKNEKSVYLLKHEQGHFDITEIFIRKMRRDIQSRSYTIKGFNKAVGKIMDKYEKASNKFQHQYDEQTNHSIDSLKQVEWNSKIEGELSKLTNFVTPVFKVKIEM